jgi:Family of unknown function (DUF6152)
MKLAARIVRATAALLLTPSIWTTAATAHHSFAAQYDINKPVTLGGVVTKMEWMNPHSRFYVDVKDETGRIVNWNVELASPNVLLRQGWTREALKPGDLVTVDAAQAKDGSNMANAQRVTLADGRRVFAGSSGGDAIGSAIRKEGAQEGSKEK